MGSYKLATAASFFVLSAAMLLAHSTNRLFPVLPVGALLAVVVLVGAGVVACTRRGSASTTQSRSVIRYVLPVTVLATVYRLFLFAFPASIVGVDPNGYAYQIARVVQSQNLSAIDIFFYSDAPLSISFPAMIGITTGVNSQLSIGIYTVGLGILSPVAVATLTAQLADTGRERKTVLAAGLAGVGTASVTFAYWPIAQSLGIIYWLVLLLFLARFIEDGSKRILSLLVLISVAQVFTHKLPLLVIFAVVLIFTVASRATAAAGFREKEYGISTNSFIIVGILGVLLIIQWAFVTEMVQAVIIRSRELFATESVSVSPPLVQQPPTDAAPPDPSVTGILVRQGYWLVLLAFGGLAWATVAYRRFGDRGVRFILVCTSVPVALLGISVAGVGGPPPLRLTSFVEPAVIPVIALAFGSGLSWARDGRPDDPGVRDRISLPSARFVLTVVTFVVLVSVQMFSPAAVPDFPSDARSYTTAQEVQAKTFGYARVDGEIHTDWFMSVSESPDCITASGPPPCISKLEARGGPASYDAIGIPLLNANVTAQGYDHVLLRTDVTYYRTSHGVWRLLWDPEQPLDRSDNRIYTNGGDILYDDVGTNESTRTETSVRAAVSNGSGNDTTGSGTGRDASGEISQTNGGNRDGAGDDTGDPTDPSNETTDEPTNDTEAAPDDAVPTTENRTVTPTEDADVRTNDGPGQPNGEITTGYAPPRSAKRTPPGAETGYGSLYQTST
jgi:hypothetical protein